MSIFGGKTKVSVSSQTFPLITTVSNNLNNIIVNALLKGQNLASTLLQYNTNSFANKIDQIIDYAENTYTLGLPQGSAYNIPEFDSEVIETIITTDLNLTYGCKVLYNFTENLNAFYAIIPWLELNRGYNTLTQKITILPSIIYSTDPNTTFNATLESVELQSDNSTVTITYGIEKIKYIKGDKYTGASYDISNYTYFEDITLSISQNNYHFGQLYCMAKYYELDNNNEIQGEAKWWFYDMDSLKYPTINKTTLLNAQQNTKLFPVIPLRYNNEDYTSTNYASTELYQTSKQLLSLINLDFNDLGSKLNSSPSIDDIDHAYLLFGIDLQSNEPECIRYLIEFFDYISDEVEAGMPQYQNKLLNQTTGFTTAYSFFNHPNYIPATNNYTVDNLTIANSAIIPSLIENGLDLEIVFNNITSIFVNGSIGSIDTVTKEIQSNVIIGWVSDKDTPLQPMYSDIVILKHQVEDNLYKQITIIGLLLNNKVYKDHTIHTTAGQIQDDPDNHNFIIPLQYNIIKRIPYTQQDKLFQYSFQVICQSIIKTHVPWYATSFFHVITIAITIAFTIYTGQGWLLNILDTLVEEGITLALITEIMTVVIEGIIINEIIKVTVKVLGIKNSIYVAFTLFITSLFMKKSFKLDFGEYILKITADKLLYLTSSIFTNINTLLEDTAQNLIEEFKSFEEQISKKWDELEQIRKDLGLDITSIISTIDLLDMTDATQTLETFDQTPTDFYNRTVHTNNIGVLTLDFIPNYVDLCLQLPYK